MNALSIALDSIWHHRVRSLLTALGIIIGVFAVVTLTALGGGVSKYVNQKFSTVGANLITVIPALPSTHSHHKGLGGGPHGGFSNVPSTLTTKDVAALNHAHNSSIKNASGQVTVPSLIKRSHHAPYAAAVMGVSSPYFSIQNLTIAQGSFGSTNVVLGHSLAHALFPHTKAIGHTVSIDGHSYAVSGILKSSQGSPGSHPNDTAYMPLNSALSAMGRSTISAIVIAASSAQTVTHAVSAARHILLKRHPSHAFKIVTSQQILSTITHTTSVITDFLAGVAGISLLVGGIGIMNIMLVTVSERFREIGIRKSLGARNSDILIQFLSESVLLAVIGGLLGTILSGIAVHFIGKGIGIATNLTVSSVMTAVIFSLAVGVIFGVLPAMRAAKLMPADALRTE